MKEKEIQSDVMKNLLLEQDCSWGKSMLYFSIEDLKSNFVADILLRQEETALAS